MSDWKGLLLRHIDDIKPVSTSHGVGEKRIVALRGDVGYPITQIARTRLEAGETVESHIHPTMAEHFFFLEGECEISIDNEVHICKANDYLFISATHSHAINVIKDTVLLTIGLATE